MLLILLLVFATIVVSVLAFAKHPESDREIIAKRLVKISANKTGEIEEEFSESFSKRVLMPFLRKVSEILYKITPREMVSKLEVKISSAGMPFKYGINDWLGIIAVLIFAAPIVIVIIGFLTRMESSRILIIAGVSIFLGIAFPNLILSNHIKKRKLEITTTLPDILDLLTVSVEAGLGFDAALAKVVEKIPGVLASEFDRVLQEIKMGKARRDALRAMADRLKEDDLTTFIASIIQADQLGVGIGNVLRIQSNQMRLKRRQRAQEKAMKAPVKMLIPMVVFIFPTIFVVLLGPAVIRMLDAFKK